MRGARLLVRALRDPGSIGACDWAGLISAARAEQLIGSLAFRMEGQQMPPRVAALFEAARRDAAQARVQALWEAERPPRAGAAGRADDPDEGTASTRQVRRLRGAERRRSRHIGAAPQLPDVEAPCSKQAGSTSRDADGYDDAYYRQWMHELRR